MENLTDQQLETLIAVIMNAEDPGSVTNDMVANALYALHARKSFRLANYKVINDIADLPPDGSPLMGYLLGQMLYLYVGEGGNTLDGKYRSVDLSGVQGKSAYQCYYDTTSDNPKMTEAEWLASLKGDDGVDLGEAAIADNLTTDDPTKVLSAKQGKVLKELIPTVVNDLMTGGEGSALSAEMGKVLNNKLYSSKSLASGSVAPNTVLFTMEDLAGANEVQYDFSATSGKAGYIELYKEGASTRYALIGKSSGSSGALDYSGTISIPNDFGRAVWKGTDNGTFRTLSCSVLKDVQILATVDEVKDEILETVSFPANYYESGELLAVGLDIAVGDILNYNFSVASGEIGVIKFVASDGTLVSQIGKTSTSGSTLAFSGSVAIPANTAFVRILNITINSLTYTKKRIYVLEQYQAIDNAKYVPFANKLVCDNDDINEVLTGLYITNKDILADLENITSIEIYGGTGASAAARPLAGIIFNGTNEIRCYYENNDASQLTKYMSHVFYCNGVFAVIDWDNLQKWSSNANLRYIERNVELNTSVVTDVASNPIIEAYIGRTTINRDYKLISFAGDSITYGLKDEADGGGQWVAFPSLVGDALQIKTMNYGVPSATCMISSTAGQRSWCRDYTLIREDSDIVAMMIGINDCYRGFTLGTMADRTNATFYGALHVMWQGLLDRFPPKDNKRLFMIDYFEIDETPIADTTWQSFVQAQREVAEYYSIPICYLSKELGITPQIDTGYEYWGVWSQAGDHSPHPKQPAHDAIARIVASWIKAHLG